MRLQRRGAKISIVSVAAEAGVHHTTVHNRHSDLAETIRGLNGKASRQAMDLKQAKLREALARNRELRAELDAMRADMRSLASENLRMHTELLELRAVANDKTVIPLGRRK
ncbi:MAG: TetR family transcriptional regulator [Rhizobacter sp.]